MNLPPIDLDSGPPSPCVSVCRLDADAICSGCWRTRQEIAAWSTAEDVVKRLILENCRKRQRQQDSRS